MIKTLTLETISYKTRRAKFIGGGNDLWLSISPFVSLDDLKFGKEYDVNVVMDKNSQQWFIDEMKVKENV